MDFESLHNIKYITAGILVTLQYSLISVSIGFILGSLLTLCKISRMPYLQWFANIYTSIFRGTPVLVQLSIIYFGVPSLTGFKISAFTSGIIAFSLNSTAYLSETIRSGILSVDKGQFEAAKALGVRYWPMMIDIIFPQALRNILPALINEIVDMVKETAIISMIGVADIMRRAQIVAAQEYDYFTPLIIAALSYYIVVLGLSTFAKYVERRLQIPA